MVMCIPYHVTDGSLKIFFFSEVSGDFFPIYYKGGMCNVCDIIMCI
jgi:hypothetical protein